MRSDAFQSACDAASTKNKRMATQTNAVKSLSDEVDFSLSGSKCTVSARFLHGFKTCKGCKSLQNRTKGAETRNSKPAMFRKKITLKRNFQKIEGITRCALRISRPGVRVPSIAPRKTRTRLCSVFLLSSTMEWGVEQGGGAQRRSKPLACGPTRRNVYRGSCEIERFHGFLFVSHECTVAERARAISRRFKTEKMKFHIDKTSRQVYNRTWKQQGIAAKSVRMPLWIETG